MIKLSSESSQVICKSFVAGILIGLGVIINVSTSYPPLGAALFSFGLLTIIQMRLPLYTGKIGFLEKHLVKILISNLVGIGFCVLLYCNANPQFATTLTELGMTKFSKTFLEMFFYGIFCGMLIHFAVKVRTSYITFLAVVIFILIGAEHCIADFPYLIYNLSSTNVLKFLCVVAGNSVGAIMIEGLVEEIWRKK